MTLKVDRIETEDGSSGIGTGKVISGAIKAWGSVNHTTATILDSFNVASFTDVGTGQPKFNFTNAMSADNYGVSGSVQGSAGAMYGPNSGQVLTTSVQGYTHNHAGSAPDYAWVSVTVSGELA